MFLKHALRRNIMINHLSKQVQLTGFADELSPNFDAQLSALNRLTVPYIELRGIDGINVSDLTNEKLREVKEKLNTAGIQASSIGSPIGKISIEDDFAPHLEKLKRTLEIQKELAAPYLRMFSFYIPKGTDPANCRGQVLDRLSAMIEEARRWDAVLLHENEKGIYGDTAPRCLDLMEQLSGPNFRAVFDFANFVEVGQPTQDAYQMLRPYIEYVHVKDCTAEGKIVPAGQGVGRVEDILGSLLSGGWKGFLSLEPHLVDFAGLAALEHDPQKRGSALTGPEAWELALTSLRDILRRLDEKAGRA